MNLQYARSLFHLLKVTSLSNAFHLRHPSINVQPQSKRLCTSSDTESRCFSSQLASSHKPSKGKWIVWDQSERDFEKKFLIHTFFWSAGASWHNSSQWCCQRLERACWIFVFSIEGSVQCPVHWAQLRALTSHVWTGLDSIFCAHGKGPAVLLIHWVKFWV